MERMQVDPRWRRIQELVEAAEAWPAEQRERRLKEIEPDVPIRAEVLDLLDAMDAEQRAPGIGVQAPVMLLPDFIGPYRVQKLAGSGGRGGVYRASREVAGVRQDVAVKVLLGHLVTPAGLARFEREQRMLASLQHPGVARFLDAGWDENHRPYLAMEWVDGESITDYSRSRGLTAEDRIRLMLGVLDALQAAHRSLIVHLDVKPSNILVDSHGRAKLLDFGTAKLLEADDPMTTTRQLTPRYASPEQLRGGAVTTACDVYGAGLTLYELLTGSWPFPESASIAALAERAAGKAELRIAAGNADLNAVLGKALRFAASERYAGAAEFAADLSAYLEGRPVRARRLTLGYRAMRFVARNKAAVAAGMALVALGAYGLWQQQARYAEALRAREIATFLRGMIASSAVPGSGTASMTVLDMVARGNERIERGAALPDDVGALLQADFAHLTKEAGREDAAEKMARQAMARADRSASPEPRLLARQTLATLLMRRADCTGAMALFREADAIGGGEAEYMLARAVAASQCDGKPAEAVRRIEQAIRVAEKAPPRSFLIVPEVFQAIAYLTYTLELSRMGRHAEAAAAAGKGLALAARYADGRYLQVALLRIRSQAAAAAGDTAGALADIRRAAELAPGVVNLFEQFRLRTLLAGRLADAGQKDQAAQVLNSVLPEARKRAADIGPSYWMLPADGAEVQARIGACGQMAALYREVDAVTKGAMPRSWLGNRLFYEAECFALTDPPKAAESARKALLAYGELLPAGSKRRARLEQLREIR
ncbi:MAG: serine/threonine protein kinase [Bryobacterales bacterium]|nr:serine/threonine protein kinase [Bryobacterales bacterium]